jgi:hypothetical protein
LQGYKTKKIVDNVTLEQAAAIIIYEGQYFSVNKGLLLQRRKKYYEKQKDITCFMLNVLQLSCLQRKK